MPGGPGRQLCPLQQEHVGNAHSAEVIGNGAADDPAPDDDDFRRGG
jgi:hypothetical protein